MRAADSGSALSADVAACTAIAPGIGAEAALLDIKGKALGVPVYELLGDKHRDTVACYANGWFRGAKTADDFADKARAAVAMGFRGLKWDPFGDAWLEMDRAARSRTMGIVEAVRAAVGPDIDLMIEVHGRLNVPTAIAMARELARFHPRWFEEPVPPESIDALADVRYTGMLGIESFTADNATIATAASIWRPLAESQDTLATRGLEFLRDWRARWPA